MKLSISAQSHVGLVRTNNEDMALIGIRQVRDEVYEVEIALSRNTPYVIALADGMGGHNAGEVASQETLKSLSELVGTLPCGLSMEELTATFSQWVQKTHAHLQQMGDADPACAGMGTTLVGMFLYEGRMYWMNCGDSRIYRMNGGELQQLSEDHSYERLTGRKDCPNVITNCVGCGDHVYLDMYTIDPAYGKGLEEEEEVYLLCSDGLTDLIPDEQLSRFLRAGLTAPALVRAALGAGGRDNVSAVTVKVKNEE